ncbi:MAG TPA: hypothetical protein VFW29_04605 [Solirubrobacteraceae bacterium]|nr:hypothetical protein [Solirubrobacteraceae bacterium]
MIDPSVEIARGAVIEVGATGRLEVGAGSLIGRRARIVVGSGGLRLGSGVELGQGASIVALEEVDVEDGVSLGELSVVMDFLAPEEAVEAPLRRQRLVTIPVRIGRDAAVGEKAVVCAGAVVPAGGRVLAGATVGRVA